MKLMFDENFGTPLVDALGILLNVVSPFKVEVESVPRVLGQGQKDGKWIPQVKKGGWIVVTQDRSRRHGGDKMARVCRENSVTHVDLSGTLGSEKQLHKVRAILAVWEQFEAIAKSPSGTRYGLRYTPARTVVLEQIIDESTAISPSSFELRAEQSPVSASGSRFSPA